jgi:hypothetical protein
MCSNAAHGEVTSIKYYVIKFVSDLRQVIGFLQALWFPNKTDLHDIFGILLKVALKHQKSINQSIYSNATVRLSFILSVIL